MKRFFLTVLFLLAWLFLYPQQNAVITGNWQGALKVGAIELRLILTISDSAGMLVSTLDSPDQGVYKIPTESTSFTNMNLKVDAPGLAAQYKGILQPGDSVIKGIWSQGGKDFELNLKRLIQGFILNRPQEPKAPFSYHEEEVSFINGKAGITLAGTLLLPEGSGPFPAVVLVSGSGPQNRDEELLGHKPFLIIADHFARKGIAVLRFDDRGIAKSEGDFASATSFDFADDAEAAFRYLLTRPEVIKSNIGIAGHSEGGLIAPIVAARNPDLGFIILMAGPGTTGRQIILDQSRLIQERSGESKKEIKESTAMNIKIFRILDSEPDSTKAADKINEMIVRSINASKSIKASEKPEMVRQSQQSVRQMMTPWFRTFLFYDPVPTLRKVSCPVLAINGTNDLQVPCNKNLNAIEKALKEGGNTNYKTVALHGLNHLFQPSETGLPSEYGKIETTFAPEALNTMSDWIKALK